MYCIYQITNKINGNRYIGQHKYEDESNPMGEYKGSGLLLHKAYKKYGIENFETEILYKRVRDKATIDAMEIWAIEKYKPEYNIAKGGSGGITQNMAEFNRNQEIIKKRVDTFKKNHPAKPKPETSKRGSDEWRKKQSEAHKGKTNGMKGKHHSEEAKRKMSEAKKGKSAWNKGYRATPEQVENNRKAQKEYWSTHTNPNKGRKWYTNGEKNVMSFECPEGYWRGIAYARRQGKKIWGGIIATIAGAVVVGVANAVATADAIDKKIKGYKEAAKEVREAAEKYSGKNAYNEELTQGKDMSSTMGDMAGSSISAESLQNNNPGVTGAGAMANAYQNAGTSADTASNAAQGGFQAGMNNASTELESKYNKATTRAKQLMKQADIDYNVSNQRNKEMMNSITDTMKTFNTIIPRNNGKNDGKNNGRDYQGGQ